MISRRFLILAPAVALVAACATQPMSSPVSVADTIARTPDLSTLNGLVVQSGLAETLKSGGPYTVFAPTNAAFAEVPAKTLAELSHDPAKLKAVLSYHVVPARVMAADVKTMQVKSVAGANLGLAKSGEFVTVEDAMVQQADIAATNGVVHTVDRVMMPPR